MAKKRPTWNAVAIPGTDSMSVEEFAAAIASAFNTLDQNGYSPAERIALPKKGIVVLGVRKETTEDLEVVTLGSALLGEVMSVVEQGIPADKAVQGTLSGKIILDGKEASVQDYYVAVKELKRYHKKQLKQEPDNVLLLGALKALISALEERIRLSVQ